MATEPLQSALPPRPQGATGAQEDASGNLRWHDGYGKDLGPADDSGAPQDTPQAAPKAASANPFDDAPQADNPFATAPKAASANPFDDAPQATAPKKGWGRRALDAFEENPGMGIASGLPSTIDALVNGKPLPHNLVGSLTDTATGAGKVISSVVHGEGKQAAQQMLDLLPQANKDRAEMTMNAAGEALSGHLGQAAQDMTKEEISKFVTPGSLIEKGIQTFSPKFKGTAALPEALQAPIVDVASNIDKNDHPVGKAIAENIQGLTSIQSLVTLAATDGVGLVKGPLSDVLKSSTGRNVASRMMSLGFSADAVMAAVQHSKSAYDAFMKGDNNEAEYELTHGVTSGTFAALAGTHAAGSDAPGKIVDKAVDVAKGALDTLSAPFKGDDLGTMYNQLSAPSKSMNKGGRFDDKVKTALPALSETIDQNPDISTPQEFGKAIDNYRAQRDGSILSKAAELRGTPAVEMTGIEDEVIKGIKQHFDENPGQYTKEEQNEALNKVVDHIRQEKVLNGQQRFDAEPDLFEAEGVRQRFNQDTAPSYDGTKEVVPAAEAAAKKIAANVLRTAIDAKYDELGISGVREWRQQEAALIDVRDAISAQSQKAVQMGQFGAWKTFVGQLKWKTAALAAAGAGGFGFGGEHGLIGGLVAGTGGMLADVFHEWLVDQRKNPNVMVQKIINKSVEANEKIKAQGGKINPASPEFGPAKPRPILPPMQGADNQAAVTGVRLDPVTHMPIDAQGNIIPKNPSSLRSPIERALENGSGTIPTGSGVMAPTDERMDVPMTRMPEGFDQDAFHHHELAHHANAVAEGIRTSDIASHQHPDLAGSTAAGGLGYDEKPLIHQRNATEKFTPEELLEDMRKWLAQYAAGAVGNELIDGIPIHQNEGLVGDIRQMKELLKRHGIEGDGAIQEIEGAIQRARKNLSNPGILDSIKSNAQVREENLHPTLHYSRGRLMGIAEELRGLNEEPNPTGTEGQRQGGKPDSSGAPQANTGRRATDSANGPEGRQAAQGDSGRVGTANDRPQVTYKPSEKAATMSAERKDYGPEFEAAQREHEIDRNKKILRNSAATDADRADAVARLADLQNPETNQARSYVETDTPVKPKERTTGDPDRDEMIRQAGGIPAGIMKGDPSIGLPEYTLFHEPESGSTLALKTKNLSPESIKQHLANKQSEYQVAAHEKEGGSTYSAAGKNLAGENLYSVGAHPDRTLQVDKLTPEILNKFKTDNADLLSKGDRAVGTWKDSDTGKSVLDITKTHTDRAEAVAAGQAANQKAIYHLGGEGEIPTGGTGESPEKTPFSGVHYSKVERDTLLGNERGKAVAGEEAARLQHDNKVPGVYAYRDGVRPEQQIAARRFKYAIKGDKAIADIGGKDKALMQNAFDQAFDKYKAAGENDTIAQQKALNDAEAHLRDIGYDGYENNGSAFLYGDHPVTQPESGDASNRSMLQGEGPRDRYDIQRMLSQTPEEAHAERMRDLGSALQDKFDEMENKDSGRSPLQGEWQPPKGLEQGISKDDAIATDIPLNKLSVSEHAYNGAASNYFRKNGSKTEGPISVVYENGQYKVEDGMHRLVQAHQEGKTTIPAKIWSGYSDSASVLPENKMDLSPIDDEDGERSPLEGDRVSTRVTAGKKATEDHMQGEPLIINRAAMDDRLREKFAGKIADVAGVKVPKNITDPDKITDRAVRHFADNLKHIYGTVPPEQQIANGKWYESAHNMTKDIAEKNGFSHSQIAGATAALSPQMEWDMNVTQMKRLVDTVKNQGDTPVSPEMIAKGEDIIKRSRAPQKGSAKPANQRLEGIIQNIGGKTLNQLDDLYDKAAFVRLHDETYGSSNFPRIDPATGEERELRTNNDGSPSKLAWGNLDNLAKALSILKDGSRENVSNNIGDSHKVRNFYNNIIDPTNPNDVTIDTHAVGAATLQPLGGNAEEVLDNFGKAGKSTATGIKGTYPIYADAYRLAAKELGVLPRALQSVTWEKVRDLFPAEWKTADNLKAVKNIWKQHEKGDITAPDARKQIIDMAEQARAQVAQKRAANAPQWPGQGDRVSALDFVSALGQYSARKALGGE